MKLLKIALFVTSLLAFSLMSCSGGKQNTANALSQEEVKEVKALDSLSNELENSLEEIENSEAELQKALEDLDL